jgi:hypothetical protein
VATDASAGSGGGRDGSVDAGTFPLCAPPAYSSCDGVPTVASSDLCARIADAYCSFYKRCNLLPDFELAACVTNVAARCQSGFLPGRLADRNAGRTAYGGLSAVAGGRAAYDGVSAACCAKHLKEEVPCTALNNDIPLDDDPACRQAFRGNVATNGACYDQEDCATGYCDKSTCPGVCKPLSALGAPCSNDDQCGPQARCLIDIRVGGGTRCMANRCLGAPCGRDLPSCDQGLLCQTANDVSTCRPPPTLGDSCDTETSTCDLQQSSCNFSLTPVDGGGSILTGKCGAPVGSGGPCASRFDCQAGYYCVGPVILPAKGTCTPVDGIGATCDPFAFESTCGLVVSCQLPDNKCGFVPLAGEHCVPRDQTADNCASGLYCNTSVLPAVCATARGAGASCSYDKQCLSEQCIAGQCRSPCTPP